MNWARRLIKAGCRMDEHAGSSGEATLPATERDARNLAPKSTDGGREGALPPLPLHWGDGMTDVRGRADDEWRASDSRLRKTLLLFLIVCLNACCHHGRKFGVQDLVDDVLKERAFYMPVVRKYSQPPFRRICIRMSALTPRGV